MSIVTLSNGKSFKAALGETLLASASKHDLTLEYSCRTGRCGVCKAKVMSGKSKIEQAEQALTAWERQAGFIFTCCRSAISDMVLDIEDLGELAEISVKTLPCRIDMLEQVASDVIKVTLRLPPNSSFRYLSGQYVDIIGKGGVRRSYSIANADTSNGKLELHIRKVEQGIMSKYWFNEASDNDLLRLEGPLGTFFLRSEGPANIVFIATGTGIAPVKAMLEEMKGDSFFFSKNVYLYWGGRVPEDIYWQPSFDAFDLSFIPVLSRASSDWAGRRGYVQHVLLEDRLDLEDAIVYACGSDKMISSAREVLGGAGLPNNYFYSDAFVSSS